MTDLPDLPDLPETTLDPEDWGTVRAAGHAALDEMFDWLMTLRDRPAWQPMPPEAFPEFRAASAAGATGPGPGRRGLPARRAAVPDWQHPSAILGVGAGHRDRRWCRGGDPDRGDERERLGWSARRALPRGAGAGLVQGTARLPRGRDRGAGEWWVDRQPGRAASGPGCDGWGRCRWAGTSWPRRTTGGLCLHRDPQ